MYWSTSARKTKRTAPISESNKGRVFSEKASSLLADAAIVSVGQPSTPQVQRYSGPSNAGRPLVFGGTWTLRQTANLKVVDGYAVIQAQTENYTGTPAVTVGLNSRAGLKK
jgi:hypothetical protein